tara:strand:+ start:5014 stop:6609 length:1596 start_codon:yes stop_codon:yes gene_type:complete
LKLNYIIFLLGSFLIIFGSNFFLSKNEALNTKESAEEKSTSEFSVPEQGYEISEENVEEMQAVDRSKLLKFSNNLLEGEISLIGASINNVRLRNFFVNPGSTKTVELFGGSEFFSKLIFKAKDFEINTSLEFDKIIKNEKSEIILSKNLGDREIIVRYLIPPDSYSINREVIIKNKSSKNFIFRLFEESIGIVMAQEYYDFSYYYGDDVEKIDSTPSETKKEIENITWFGFSKKYFLGANIIDGSGEKNLKYEKKSTSLLRTVVSHKTINLLAGGQYNLSSTLFLGPKDYKILSKYGDLEKAHDLGWFDWLASPLEKLLNFSNTYIKNYGLAIIFITILIRVLFLPLTVKSMMSMKKMQSKMAILKPKLDEIKEKFKDDKATQNSEIMKLYSKEGMNPLSSLSGCLPMLIQLPVFVALYNVLLYSLDLRHTSFWWISDLSSPENLFDIFGIPFRALPLIMGISWYITQKMTPPNPGADEFQTKIFQYMPILFTVMFWGLPSGLILYWTVSNIISIFQQIYINQKFKRMQGA